MNKEEQLEKEIKELTKEWVKISIFWCLWCMWYIAVWIMFIAFMVKLFILIVTA